ncbi:MAG: nitroreductase family protein [Patescibacteria group bacterium]
MINAIKKRRAIREYLNEPVADEKIQELLKAAACAPSANAKYPWELVIVKSQATKELLAKTTPWATFAKDSAVIIAVIGDEKNSAEWVEDCSIVAEHIWLETAEQGLGCCWIQIRNQGEAEKKVKEILNIPDKYRVLCLLPIGVLAEELAEHDEKDTDKSKFKNEKYK